jgi:hypothetical protein
MRVKELKSTGLYQTGFAGHLAEGSLLFPDD